MSVSPRAKDALDLLNGLQSRFVAGLESIAAEQGDATSFDRIEWQRDDGRHGGGHRDSAPETCRLFNRGSVNVSQIHYNDLPEKKLGSATALSTIIHPANPHAPSVHIHISWTEMKDGHGYWRIMADLNPSVVHQEYRDDFTEVMRQAAPEQYADGAAQGERYFFIPALGRHRGVTHFYLESYASADRDADRALAERFGQAVIDGYLRILARALEEHPQFDADDLQEQLAYHTLYFFQVLTLDRGTTSGLLVHDQNDVGTLGSLPARIDRELLASWQDRVESPQDELVAGLLAALPASGDGEAAVDVTDEVKAALAQTVREHYQRHPKALAMQASGGIIPPTVDNHS